MSKRRKWLLLGIGLLVIDNVIFYTLNNRFVTYSSGSYSRVTNLDIIALPFGVVGAWFIIWAIFGREFRGYPKADKEETWN